MKRCVEFMKSNLPYIYMILCNILVGAGTVLFSKVAIANGMNPYVFGAYRQAFATLALAPFSFFLERKNSAPLSFNLLCKIFLASMSGWSQLLEKLALPNIKWICPTAPTLPVAILGGFPRTAWFDVGELSEDSPDDFEGLDATEPANSKLLPCYFIDYRPLNYLISMCLVSSSFIYHDKKFHQLS
ncbi:WAT1-related protein At5g64700-like [Camellia sinensis]|uniref:WAT1-related protein At5g64700-like n=1 Tax=Camellia sinensis TaxID=4442 RepID=UPI001035D9A3|nr:WAT1-related protein At5g64700-like [Camellia sinensis]